MQKIYLLKEKKKSWNQSYLHLNEISFQKNHLYQSRNPHVGLVTLTINPNFCLVHPWKNHQKLSLNIVALAPGTTGTTGTTSRCWWLGKKIVPHETEGKLQLSSVQNPGWLMSSWTTAVGFGGFWGVLGADNVVGCPPYKIISWICFYATHSSLAPYPGTRYQLLLVTCKTLLIFALLFFLGGFGGADNVLGCPPYKIISWTCCYAIHSSLAPYPGTRYQLLLVTYKTLLIFALLFLLVGFGGADNVLGCPPYKIISWTCCYAIHSSLAPYPGTRYQLLLVTCKTLLIFALLFFLGGFWGGW